MLDCRQLSSATSPLSSSVPHLGKLMRKPRTPSSGTNRSSKHTSGLTCTRPLTPLLPLIIIKAELVSSLTLSSHFWTCLGPCPAPPRKPHYVSNKPVHVPLVHMWHRQSQHLKQMGYEVRLSCKGTIPHINGDCGQQRPFLGGDLNELGSEPCRFLGEYSVGEN